MASWDKHSRPEFMDFKLFGKTISVANKNGWTFFGPSTQKVRRGKPPLVRIPMAPMAHTQFLPV